jgi:hypothetical protein
MMSTQLKTYEIQRIRETPPFEWDGAAWQPAQTADVAHFYPGSSEHHPLTQARLLYDERNLHGIFRVEDRYVRCIHGGFQEPVWQDACVELFVKPLGAPGYFNFEMNCGGALLSYYIIDPTPVGEAFVDYVPLPPEVGSLVCIRTSMPTTVEPEIAGPVTWTLRFTIPFVLFEHFMGPLEVKPGQEWRANFNKCAENNSHPHWATWQPLPFANFHLPGSFGVLRFI